ncbi:MAG TPA: chromosomal replication initiator protein DnaA [Ruminococcaceae bacterium]|nr:chromosomal replication initiator protein DnaA [Oscillospiraceae bacterium]
MDSFGDAWELVCSYCKTKITDVAYNTWIVRIKPLKLDFDNNTAYLIVPNDFHRQTINRCYIPLLNEAFEAIFDNKFNICLKTPDEIESGEHIEKNKEPEKNNNYEYTFDTFIVGSSNNFAHAACLAVATNPSNAYNPLFLYGNSGLGKTHLLYAISNEIKKNYPEKNICYIKIDDFINEMVESLKMKTMIEFRQKYRQVDVLLVDDVQFLGGKEAMQEEFFHTFNALYDAHKQIVLTSDRPPKEIKTLADRLRSRFEQDLIADIQPPDIETRIAIIKRKAELIDINLSNEVCEYIASKLKSNIRQLEGTVKKLKAKSLLNNEKITISTAQEVIADILNNDIPPEVTVERIIDEVARTYGVTSDEIRSQKNKSANISNARHIAIYITREMTTLSMVNIGEEFGGRHYSTIIYSLQKVQKMIDKDRKIKELVDDTIKNIRDR